MVWPLPRSAAVRPNPAPNPAADRYAMKGSPVSSTRRAVGQSDCQPGRIVADPGTHQPHADRPVKAV